MDLSNIRHGMEVVGADGQPLGSVDHVEHNRIKLRRNDPGAGGQHHWLPQDMIAKVDGNTVRLTMPAEQARRAWQGGAAESPAGEGRAGMGDAQTGTGGQSMAHAQETPGTRPDQPVPGGPSRDMRH
ncbi:DUF2171 domain-containing protein [Roseicella aerolata]|uniref:DUF2171 domain-containing protein n=1 Tax=Roseicella aerolata TaxID=2883479 RepID=A0A9X1L851_9PROT|nr:DUF2171 domain-containing protein [Roseicella aerolata]MCB4822189.1 DUF2171 domain-containing protein [Roseicella aerolata]